MECPKCRAEMEVVVYQSIDVHRCTDCKGLWFDSSVRERLAALPGSEGIDSGDRRIGRSHDGLGRVRCPTCDTPLIRMVDARQPHIWYESCQVCGGVFFDAGEFRDYKDHTFLDFFRDLFRGERN